MRLKIIIIIVSIILIIGVALFGAGIKEKALGGMVKDIPEYNCREGDICTSCIIEGHTCSCGTDKCTCGNETVNKAECGLYG